MNDNTAQRDQWYGRLAGAIAMLAMLTVIVVARSLVDAITLLDTIADALLLALPIGVFAWLLDLFGQHAKTLLLVGLVLACILIGIWLGGLFARQTRKEPNSARTRASVYSGVLFVLSLTFIYLFLEGRTPGAFADGGFMRTAYVLAVAWVVFGIVLLGGLTLLRRAEVDTEREDRRSFLAWGAMAVLALAGVAIVGRDIDRVARRKVTASGPTGVLPPAITPTDSFYVISKNFSDPGNNRGQDWSIDVDGLVFNKLTLNQQDFNALGGVTFVSTMLCISNTVGGDLIGTAEWTGVPLATVLEHAGVGDGAFKVKFEAVDGYTTAIPIERAMRPEPHIVWAMNGEPLPESHGAPVRMVIPGLYGMKGPKWLTKITVTEDDYMGYWEQRDWTDAAVVKTMSRIDTPAARDVVSAGSVQIGGIAFAGTRGVSGVEVTVDDGETWHEAEIREEPSPDGLAWVIWTYDWKATPGSHAIMVRATDGEGEVQTSERVSVLPDGASGWHRIEVGVS